jgi:hypothetical protein
MSLDKTSCHRTNHDVSGTVLDTIHYEPLADHTSYANPSGPVRGQSRLNGPAQTESYYNDAIRTR